MNADIARHRSRTYAELARAYSNAEPGFEREFTRLFLGPGRPVAHPCESVYREGRTMGDTTLDVRRRLAEEGLAPDGRTLPDHVGIELALMAHLAAREARAWDHGDDNEAWSCLARQDGFLSDHLAVWLPQFCHRVLAGRPVDHYAELARRTDAFVSGDAARLRAWLRGGLGAPAHAIREDVWTVTVGKGCTLCGICVQVCRPRALQWSREEGAAVLRLNTVLCDGCAACERWCPETLIRVNRLPDGERPSGSELARSAMLACPRCGQLHAPEAMVAKIQAQVEQGHEALAQRLALCHDCKAAEVPLHRHGIVQNDLTSTGMSGQNTGPWAEGRARGSAPILQEE